MEQLKLRKQDDKLLKINFNKCLKDDNFNELISKLDVSNDVLMKYTSKLMDASVEYNNCKNCKSYLSCKNNMKGFCYTPNILNNGLTFSYIKCEKKKEMEKKNEYLENVYFYEIPIALKNASFKNIYKDDSSRISAIKKIKGFYDSYKKEIIEKGIYLSGNFGSGKSYLITALFNELAKYNVKSAVIYFPEFLRKLKGSFGLESYYLLFEQINSVSLLFIDDIGAENLTDWARDEVLGTILQYRMDSKLPTFFTSNLSLKELENHLQKTNSSSDKVKARRIMERIKFLCDEVELIGVNRRED